MAGKKKEVKQIHNPKTGLWALLRGGRIEKVKKDGKPYKGVTKHR
jgi:hypothetical protein